MRQHCRHRTPLAITFTSQNLATAANQADTGDLQQNGERKGWDSVWVTGEELCQEGILLSPRMMEDHYALSLQACTQRLATTDVILAGCHRKSMPM